MKVQHGNVWWSFEFIHSLITQVHSSCVPDNQQNSRRCIVGQVVRRGEECGRLILRGLDKNKQCTIVKNKESTVTESDRYAL